ncbi:hypothetical protein [Streptomyces sp. NPDC059757]|uniref:hypothetical protein n=1 Tax=Streptomyces sp. NPDC059757 TaxID=3346935 RepID=UPI003666B724
MAAAPDVVDSGLCTQTSAVPDWLARVDQLEHLTAAPAADRRATIAILDDDVLCDLLVLSYLRDGTPYALWADTWPGSPRTSLAPPPGPTSTRSSTLSPGGPGEQLQLLAPARSHGPSGCAAPWSE